MGKILLTVIELILSVAGYIAAFWSFVAVQKGKKKVIFLALLGLGAILTLVVSISDMCESQKERHEADSTSAAKDTALAKIQSSLDTLRFHDSAMAAQLRPYVERALQLYPHLDTAAGLQQMLTLVSKDIVAVKQDLESMKPGIRFVMVDSCIHRDNLYHSFFRYQSSNGATVNAQTITLEFGAPIFEAAFHRISNPFAGVTGLKWGRKISFPAGTRTLTHEIETLAGTDFLQVEVATKDRIDKPQLIVAR